MYKQWHGQQYSFKDPYKTKFVFIKISAKYQNTSCTRLLTVFKIWLEHFFMFQIHKKYIKANAVARKSHSLIAPQWPSRSPTQGRRWKDAGGFTIPPARPAPGAEITHKLSQLATPNPRVYRCGGSVLAAGRRGLRPAAAVMARIPAC